MKKKNLVGQKFAKLTVLSEAKSKPRKDTRAYWNCQCECGATVILSTLTLTTGNTKSCGCLRIEACTKPERLKKFTTSNKQYEPRITSARRVWKRYQYQDENCTITFDEWMLLSQQNCFYCGIGPSNELNFFLNKKDASQEAKDNGNFTYNGLDRLDSSLPHIISNVVPSCWTCNRAKGDIILEKFYEHIDKLKVSASFVAPKELLILPSKYLFVSIKMAYRQYLKNYDGMEIDLQTFYTYSQLPCFYCGDSETNYWNVYLKDKRASQNAKDGAHFHYNGIDRIDSSKRHTIDNIVPCCLWCNFAKSDMSLQEFYAWISRIQQHQCQKE